MARCLVTGHMGYIGSHLYARLQELGHEVRGIDLQEGRNVLDALWREDIESFKPEYIFHLAAIPRVGYSLEHPYHTLYNNLLTSLDVLEFARIHNVKRVIYSSSSSVVGNDDGEGPTNPYGASKLIPETLCHNYSKVFGVDTVCLRYFNVYSKDQKATGPYATAVANWMQYLREGKNPFITGDGEQRRDMLHVDDAVGANVFCMTHTEDFAGKHYDVGTGKNISLNEIKDIILTKCNDVNFEYIAPRPGEVAVTRANTEPLEEIGWQANISIEQGINSCFLQKGE